MWRYAAARTTGASHLKAGGVCQDRHLCVAGTDWLLLAVADGAGSAARSDVGAQIAVETSAAFLQPYQGDPSPEPDLKVLVGRAAKAAREAVMARASIDAAEPREYACTLLLAIMGNGGGAALQIGDGVIAYKDEAGWAPIFWPQKGEYANTTRFLTDVDAEQTWQTAGLEAAPLELAVMSDGLESLALHFASRSIHEPFLEAVLSPLRSEKAAGQSLRISAALQALLESPRITDRADDDLTLCVATRA